MEDDADVFPVSTELNVNGVSPKLSPSQPRPTIDSYGNYQQPAAVWELGFKPCESATADQSPIYDQPTTSRQLCFEPSLLH